MLREVDEEQDSHEDADLLGTQSDEGSKRDTGVCPRSSDWPPLDLARGLHDGCDHRMAQQD